MTYDLDDELKKIARQKTPSNLKIIPFLNVMMGLLFKCKADDCTAVKKYVIPGYQNAKIKVQVIEPKERDEKLPGLVFFHGGGFILRASGAHYKIAKMYARMVPCRVIYADYRLAPKNPFPIPVEDCYQAYKWTLDHADQLKINSDQVMIGGDSAGGNFAAAVTLMSRDRGIPSPSAAMLIYPVTDRRMITKSMEIYTDTPVWDSNLTKMVWDAYLGGRIPEKIEYASPLEAESLASFPPTYIEVAEYDALRDEGILFCNKLRESGVNVELHEIPKSCHGFETAVESNLLKDAIQRRIHWIKEII